MQAASGDHLVVHGYHVGDPDLEAEVLEARGPDGGPPYLVRWRDGHMSTFYPGSDTVVEHAPKGKPPN